LAAAENFRWRSVDSVDIQGWLYRADPNPRRAVIYVHGGPTSHSEDRLNAEIQYLVSRGFNVLDVNYRGSTGFGLPFREAIKEDGWGGREQADIAAGAQALIEAGLADAGRVGVTGTSYGGYSAWFLLTHYPLDIIGAAAPICGMTDLVIDYETTRPDLRPYSEEMMGGSPVEVPERYAERSPINAVPDIQGRLLIVQGGQDPNVTPENVCEVVRRLDAHGIDYDLLSFEDEGHGIAKPANQQKLYVRLADFFDAALGAPAR
jgi:dipeptidyl aminopeptidase/acylaminoacyl peptidase